MAQTPRTVDDYLDALETSYGQVNDSLDVKKGPIAVMNWAFATEGSRTENFAAYIQQLFQMEQPDLIDDDDIFHIGTMFGKDANFSRQSTGTVMFYRRSRPEPGSTYTLLEGTVCGTQDNRFNFQVVETVEMNGDIADVYFNATKRWYEIPAKVTAVAVGTDYDLPPGTIVSILTLQDSFEGCYNRDYMRRGADPLDKWQFRDVIWSATQGLDRDLSGNLLNLMHDIDPQGFDDIKMVPSTDYQHFERLGALNAKLGYDVYLISEAVDDDVQTGTAVGGELSIPFDRQPVLSVDYVAVDGVSVAFVYVPDSTISLQGSARAQDAVLLATALQPGQTYEIRYLYYTSVYDLQDTLDGRSKIFGSDPLVRLAHDRVVYIAGEVGTYSGSDKENTIADIKSFTEGYFRDPSNPSSQFKTFVAQLDPYDYQQAVRSTVAGISDFQLTRFSRIDNAVMPIETITFDGVTEYPTLDPSFDVV